MTRSLAALLAVAIWACGEDAVVPQQPPPIPSIPSGELVLAVLTVGDRIDSDGFTLRLNQDLAVAVPANGTAQSDVLPGTYRPEVRDLASNCRLTNWDGQGDIAGAIITISSGEIVSIAVEVLCLEPDPGRIFYTTFGGAMHVMSPLGGDRQDLPLYADKVQVSSDLQRLVYNWDDDIWVADIDGSNPVNLTQSPDRGDKRPSWSPDGTRIAYERQEVRFASEHDIFVMNADGSGAVNLTSDTPEGEGEPAWSPDGTRIAFRSHRNGSGGDLWTVAPDGSNPAQLTTNGSLDTNPSWSPDGEKIVFTRFTGTCCADGTDFDLFVVNADGTGLTQITSDLRRTSEADWSPDGRWLVVASSGLPRIDEPGFDLFVMRADGTDRVRLTFGERAGLPTWVR